MPETGVLDVRDLRRRYGRSPGFEAVRGVSFSVERGELFALLGTNGAGKTSTVELLEGLGRPSGGSVRVFGHDPFSERAAVRPRTGMMLQEGGLLNELTVMETARMWSATLSRSRPAAEAVELVDLMHRRDAPVHQLSGGERRRLDLALAIMGRPELLFLDEPTTGLDPESRRNTWSLLRDLLLQGVTILLTTHYLEEAQELADRLAIMQDGRIVREGTVSEVVAAHPARISFTLPDAAILPRWDGVRAVVEPGARHTLHTDHLQTTLTEVLDWARTQRVALRDLDARSASLEEAFLALTDGDIDVKADKDVEAGR